MCENNSGGSSMNHTLTSTNLFRDQSRPNGDLVLEFKSCLQCSAVPPERRFGAVWDGK